MLLDKNILFVSSDIDNSDRIKVICNDANYNMIYISTLKELFRTLSTNGAFDTIIFDRNFIPIENYSAVVDAINLISTFNNVPITLAEIVDSTRDLSNTKLVISYGVHIIPHCEWLGDDVEKDTLLKILNKVKYASKQFIAKPKKIKPKMLDRVSKSELTSRQTQVMALICSRGASNKTIAKMLKISESTVKLHVSAIFKKYGVRNRTQLALFSPK